MKLFVTGAAGFIGSNYVRWLLANTDDEVTILDALTYAGNLENDPRPDRRPAVPLRARRHLRPRRRPCCRWTATTRWCTSRPRPTSTARSRTPGLVRPHQLRRHQRAVRRRACATASRGSCTSPPTRSTARSTRARSSRPTAHPRSPYSAAKAGGRPDRAQRTSPPTACPCLVTRCSNNFGPYQFPEKVIPLFVTNLLDGGTVPLYGDGSTCATGSTCDDHCTRRAPRARARRARRDLQHRRRQRDHQPRAHRPAARAVRPRRELRRAVEDRKGHDRRYSMHPRQGHGARLDAEHTSTTGSPPPWPGTATTVPGGSR
jgi:dTDP-glucose 4,6-dehydratase